MNHEMRIDKSVDEDGEPDFKNSFSRYSEGESCAHPCESSHSPDR